MLERQHPQNTDYTQATAVAAALGFVRLCPQRRSSRKNACIASPAAALHLPALPLVSEPVLAFALERGQTRNQRQKQKQTPRNHSDSAEQTGLCRDLEIVLCSPLCLCLCRALDLGRPLVRHERLCRDPTAALSDLSDLDR